MANDQRFEQLKQKYQSAMNAMNQHGIRLQNVNMQGDKLFIRGEAPSDEAKNRVWDQIKLVDPNYQDLICDISVNPSLAQQQGQQQQPQRAMGAGVGSSGQPRRYTVKAGDSLSTISREFYGNPGEYMKIFEANRDKLSDPNKIQPGQELVIP